MPHVNIRITPGATQAQTEPRAEVSLALQPRLSLVP